MRLSEINLRSQSIFKSSPWLIFNLSSIRSKHNQNKIISYCYKLYYSSYFMLFFINAATNYLQFKHYPINYYHYYLNHHFKRPPIYYY